MSKLVVVYSPEGVAEKHTMPNARDLIQGAKYTWKPGVASSPASFAPPHAVPSRDEKIKLASKPASQEIFDRYGSTATEDNDPLAAATALVNETSAPDEDFAPVEEVVEVAPVVEAAPEATEKLTELPRAPRGGRKG